MTTDLNIKQAFKNAAWNASLAVGNFGVSLAADALAIADKLPGLALCVGLPLMIYSACNVYAAINKFAEGLEVPLQAPVEAPAP